MAEELLPHARGRAIIADTAYDADRIVAAVRAQRMTPVLCNNPGKAPKKWTVSSCDQAA